MSGCLSNLISAYTFFFRCFGMIFTKNPAKTQRMFCYSFPGVDTPGYQRLTPTGFIYIK